MERHSIRCRTRHGRTTWILLQRIRRCRLHWNVMVPSFFVYSLSPVRFPGCQGFLTRLCRFRSQNRHEPQTPVHPFPDRPDHLSHRKRCQNRSDSKSIQMSQEEDRHAGGHRQTDHIKRDLYVGIRGTRNVRQFPREQICRYDRQTTAVRQCNSNADQQIADCKIENTVRKCKRPFSIR